MKKILLLTTFLSITSAAWAGPKPPKPPLTAADSAAMNDVSYAAYADSVDHTLHYVQGRVELPGGLATLQVPAGFRYLDSAQSRRVLTQIWRNPDGKCLGMLFRTGDGGPLGKKSWAYVIEYDDMGHVKDDDADDIKYDELLTEMQNDVREANPERISAGYDSVRLLGWASNPYYDKSRHALHWAKLLKFGNSAEPTLNYNVRLLGRKGVLNLNAVAVEGDMAEIKASIPGLLANINFATGQRYLDFDSGLDEVAAYSIGGLVAGKVLAKVGFFAIILKFWKIGLLALAGTWAAVKRFLGFGSKEE